MFFLLCVLSLVGWLFMGFEIARAVFFGRLQYDRTLDVEGEDDVRRMNKYSVVVILWPVFLLILLWVKLQDRRRELEFDAAANEGREKEDFATTRLLETHTPYPAAGVEEVTVESEAPVETAHKVLERMSKEKAEKPTTEVVSEPSAEAKEDKDVRSSEGEARSDGRGVGVVGSAGE